MENTDLKERIVRLETELSNLKESHNVTKGDFASLRNWVENKLTDLGLMITELRIANEKTAMRVAGIVSVLTLLASVMAQLAIKHFT